MERSGISELAPVDRGVAGLSGDLAMGIKSLEWFLMVKKSGFLEVFCIPSTNPIFSVGEGFCSLAGWKEEIKRFTRNFTGNGLALV
ncbi:hypothetical protein A3SI_02513 [Nitritalea halalkaliphila LW7]|uniref:Uncharacterized protein n=1 Tax=Nitritalea halalkaliphila LW7 TaxID=1189621 RepID=I5C9N7_9BACT|nr:hypothetical protein A3SI_02513 [Nitritalea halalkaliphila LW7]